MFRIYSYILLVGVIAVMTLGCSHGSKPLSEREESREAKALMQGLWVDQESGDVFFKMQGDTVYYPDTLVEPSAFRVVDDTLYIGSSAGYCIEKQTEHLLWFKNQNGELIKLEKTNGEMDAERAMEITKPQILTLTEVLKRDTVVMLDGQRYHLYTAINPTRYKVVRTSYNEDGIQVDQVYYDNIIHISVFQGSRQLFSQDFRKQQYGKHLPAGFLDQAILNDMQYAGADKDGFHFGAMLCYPDAASCYMIETIISPQGQLTTKRTEL